MVLHTPQIFFSLLTIVAEVVTARHRQVTDLDVTVLGLSGPGLPSARQVLCGDAPRLFSLCHFSVRLSSVLGRTELCHEVWTPGPQKPQIISNENHHLALLVTDTVVAEMITELICGIKVMGLPRSPGTPEGCSWGARAWENANFGLPARNRKKKSPKIDFDLTRKIGKKNRPEIGKMARKTIFEPFFLFWGDFFPYFPGEAKIIFRRCFSGLKSTFSQARVLAAPGGQCPRNVLLFAFEITD